MTSLPWQDGRRTCHQPRNVRTRQTVLRKHDRRLTCLWAPVKPDSVSYSHYIPESLFGGPRSRSTKHTFMLLHYASHYHHYNLKLGNDDHSHPRRIISLEISNVDAGGLSAVQVIIPLIPDQATVPSRCILYCASAIPSCLLATCCLPSCLKGIQSYLRYPYIGCPKPRLSVRSSKRGVCLKKWYFSLKSQSLRLSRVHVFLCHTCMFNVGTQ